MKRWLAAYAVAFFAFLHLPLLTLADIQLQFLPLHRVGALFSRLVSRHFPRPPADRGHLEQRDRGPHQHRDFYRDRHALRLRSLEAPVAAAHRHAVSFAGDSGNCDRGCPAGALPVDVPVAALASRALHRSSCARGVFHRLRGHRDLSPAADPEPVARRSRHGPRGQRVAGLSFMSCCRH